MSLINNLYINKYINIIKKIFIKIKSLSTGDKIALFSIIISFFIGLIQITISLYEKSNYIYNDKKQYYTPNTKIKLKLNDQYDIYNNFGTLKVDNIDYINRKATIVIIIGNSRKDEVAQLNRCVPASSDEVEYCVKLTGISKKDELAIFEILKLKTKRL